MDNKLKEKVVKALEYAFENDEEILTWTASEIANDMVTYNPDTENETPERLVPIIEEWLAHRR